MDIYEDWILVGSSYFSKRVIYSLEWSRSSRGSPGINLEYMRTSCCPFGGPIAVWRDETKVVLQLGAFSRPDIQLFTASGQQLGRILWKGSRILAAGWTTTEELLIVDDSGKVYRFASNGQPASTEPSVFSLGTACEREGIADIDIFPNGVLARTAGSGDVYYVEDCVLDPRPRKLPDAIARNVLAGRAVHCIASVPPLVSASGSLQLIVAAGSGLYAVDEQDAIVTGIDEGPFVKIVLSPDGRYLAGYAADDVLHVWSFRNGDELIPVARVFLPDTEQSLIDTSSLGIDSYYNDGDDDDQTAPPTTAADNKDKVPVITDSKLHKAFTTDEVSCPVLPSGAPDAMAWCGTDAVMAVWQGAGTLLISIPESTNEDDTNSLPSLHCEWKWLDIGIDGAVATVNERDAVRLVNANQHVLIRKVPSSLVDALEIGSTSPAALLYDARRLYDERDASAAACLLDLLRAGTLPEAVAICLDAAAMEMEASKQEALMKAGCYGRAFLALQEGDAKDGARDGDFTNKSIDHTYRTKIAETARILRVLNALMEPSVAMPLTMNQLEYLGMYQIISRLTSRHHYLLALRICDSLNISPEDVLVRWACDKIASTASSLPDAELLSALSSKLDGQHAVKWAHIAAHARLQGRTRLAASLAEREISASDQIPLLMSLNEEEKALEKALQSGDPDMIFFVLYSMWRKAERGNQTTSAAASMHRQFWSALGKNPTARAVFESFMADSANSNQGIGIEEGRLMVARAMGDHEEIAMVHICNAMALSSSMTTTLSTATEQQVQHRMVKEWSKAKEAFVQAEKRHAAASKDDSKFESAAVTAAIRLLEVQSELQTTTGRDCFVGLSVVDTVKQCLRLGMREKAQRVAKEFKVPEKQQMLLSINAAAAQQDWSALQQMASRLDRRSPVTMEHFVAAARSNGAPAATVRWFVDRLTGDGALMRRAALYAEIGLMREAQMLAEQAELTGGGSGGGMLGSLRDAVGGTVGSLIG